MAAAIAGVGAMMPWLVVTEPDGSFSASWSGVSPAASGFPALIMAVVAAICLAVGMRATALVAAVACVIAAAFAITDLNPTPDVLELVGGFGIPHAGIGIGVTIAGAIIAGLIALAGVRALREG